MGRAPSAEELVLCRLSSVGTPLTGTLAALLQLHSNIALGRVI